jgi:pimeloyl-ACP methyl ester carboxylesterase
MDGTGELFPPFLKELPAHLEPLVIPYPDDRPLGYRELLPLILSRLPKSRPFAILGESFSGPLALMVAETAPANLRAVILCATFVKNPLPYLPSAFAPLSRPALFRFFPAFARTKALLGRYSSPDLRDCFARAHRVRPEVMARRGAEILRVDVREELRRCRLPLLYLRGSEDRVVPLSNQRLIQKLNPEVKCVSIEGAGHLVLQVAPGPSAREIAEFLA